MGENIILIGFMGAGKTTLGRWISQNVCMGYIDTDEYIEKEQGITINEIFSRYGEEYFRDLETQCIKDLIGKAKQHVISVGGGMPVREENRELLKQLGCVVYLKADEEELVKRLSNDDKRPMLKGEDLRTRIHTLMEKREACYMDAAKLVVETTDKNLEQQYNCIEDFMIKG